MKHGSLFSGIGGFDLAAEWMGWDNIFHCEINEFCQKILKQHFPNARTITDIKRTDFTEWRDTIDILTGGFPCQPFSQTGKRKGTSDDRYLWPEMLRAIREIKPSWIVGENVRGIVDWEEGMVFDKVQTDLENESYEVWAFILPACSVDAPHKRDRVWFIAYSNSNANRNIEGQGREENGLQGISRETVHSRKFIGAITENVAYSNNQGLQGSEINGSIREIGQERNKQFAGCVPSVWQNFPTQPPLCGRDDGIPNRVDRIKALGNAIVPQVAYEIFKSIEKLNLQL